MLYWAAVFFIVALIAAVLGFGGIAAGAAGIAKILFFIFLVAFVVSLLVGVFRRGVDPVQLYISIAGEGYFYLSNRYTLSRIFDRDLMAPRALSGRARHISHMILNALKSQR